MATNRSSTPDKVELARRINNAIISYTMGVSYQTAEKNYGRDVDPHPSFVEACWQLYQAKVEGVSQAMTQTSDKQIEPSTEDTLLDTLRAFIGAVQNKKHVHFGRSYTNDPKHPGMFVCFVSCPAEMADRLKAKMDKIVPAEFAEEGVKQVKVTVQ